MDEEANIGNVHVPGVHPAVTIRFWYLNETVKLKTECLDETDYLFFRWKSFILFKTCVEANYVSERIHHSEANVFHRDELLTQFEQCILKDKWMFRSIKRTQTWPTNKLPDFVFVKQHLITDD